MKVLFVCTGNTCRSPMAEAIFNKLCNLDGVEAFSSGLSTVSSSIISHNSYIAIKENLDIDLKDRVPVQFCEELFNKSDIILTMTKNHREIINYHFKSKNKKVFTISEFAGSDEEIRDPFGGDIETYRKTFNQLKKHIEVIIDNLSKNSNP